jgi:TetR/AcrR family transcriptional repressor of nem operon
MPRPREFDADEALQRALDVFWRKGFEATSMRDLVAAMRIQKASLYGAFGDKRSLYLATLRRYQQQVLDELTERLAKAPSPSRAVREFVAEVAEQVAGGEGRRGCFCVNANIELAPHDDGVAEQLRAHHDRMVALIAATLERARSLGEIPRRADCTALATFLLGVVAALNVLGKQRASRQQLQAVVDNALTVLDP